MIERRYRLTSLIQRAGLYVGLGLLSGVFALCLPPSAETKEQSTVPKVPSKNNETRSTSKDLAGGKSQTDSATNNDDSKESANERAAQAFEELKDGKMRKSGRFRNRDKDGKWDSDFRRDHDFGRQHVTKRDHDDKGDHGNKHQRRHGNFNSLDDDYTMDQVWTLPNLTDKQRKALVEIQENFKIAVVPLRQEHHRIRDEFRQRRAEFTQTDAGPDIGGAVMNGLGKIDPDEVHTRVLEKKRTPDNLLTKSGKENPDGRLKSNGTLKRGEHSDGKKWNSKDHHRSVDSFDESAHSAKTARDAALFNRFKLVKKKVRDEKQKAWAKIFAVLTPKQEAALAKL